MNTELNLDIIVEQTRTSFLFKKKVCALKFNCANVLAFVIALKYVTMCKIFLLYNRSCLNKFDHSRNKHYIHKYHHYIKNTIY